MLLKYIFKYQPLTHIELSFQVSLCYKCLIEVIKKCLSPSFNRAKILVILVFCYTNTGSLRLKLRLSWLPRFTLLIMGRFRTDSKVKQQNSSLTSMLCSWQEKREKNHLTLLHSRIPGKYTAPENVYFHTGHIYGHTNKMLY